MYLDTAEKRAMIPSWIISTLIHTALITLLLFWISRMPQGSAEVTSRDIGIVLKRSTADGVKFEGEDDNLADQNSTNNSSNPTPSDPVEALPEMTANSNSAESLPELPDAVGTIQESGGSSTAAAEAGGTTGGVHGDIGDKAAVPFFGVTGTGTKFVYLVDRSASMEGPPLQAAKQQVGESLKSLDEIHQFQIIFFNMHAYPMTINNRQRVAFATEQNKTIAGKQVLGVTAALGTDRINALKEALRLGPDVIFFLTDADGPMSAGELDEVARINQRYNAMICAVEFGVGPDPRRNNFLRELANRTGGQYCYVNTNSLRSSP
ncbi:vWA domain-containing protein [Aeoliella mucimassa]|uniref:Uncharacterized protein n=1 Tax=Aeoliella mucimassa TaxID=2527972 RepID=A0A518AII7_9BACT|nr:VWA domain-containing protein [Aeoliella mucimassa]QDU54542.1 hypothetical protein Pan181_07250 [Aeoliella mucimassa]